MAGYPKLWTRLRHRPWFRKLKAVQKCIWYEMIMIAKEQTDDGWVCFPNVTAMAAEVGCERGSCEAWIGRETGAERVSSVEKGRFICRFYLTEYNEAQGVRSHNELKNRSLNRIEEKGREGNRNNIPATPDSIKPTSGSGKDPTRGYILDAIISEIKSKLGATCDHKLAGVIVQRAGWKAGETYPWGLYGHIMVCIGRVSTWINENHFIGAISRDLKCRHGKLDGSFAWPEADLTLIKAFEGKFEQWMKREFPQKMDFKIVRPQ